LKEPGSSKRVIAVGQTTKPTKQKGSHENAKHKQISPAHGNEPEMVGSPVATARGGGAPAKIGSIFEQTLNRIR